MISCDGLWEGLDMNGVRSCIRDHVNSTGSLEGAAQALCAKAREKGSMDNITVMVVDIKPLGA